MPAAYAMGFVGALLVLGVQVLNPFCPEPVVRFLALVFLALFGLAVPMGLFEIFSLSSSDGAIFSVPACELGVAAGAAYVLRKWTNFEPLEVSPLNKTLNPDAQK
jgi:hypothetical protein